jgi:hypothetical protein
VISSDHLDPGAVGRVKTSVATDNIRGPVAKHVTIYSNDRITPAVSVEVTLEVVPKTVVPK